MYNTHPIEELRRILDLTAPPSRETQINIAVSRGVFGLAAPFVVVLSSLRGYPCNNRLPVLRPVRQMWPVDKPVDKL
jgi:hypothetical protein